MEAAKHRDRLPLTGTASFTAFAVASFIPSSFMADQIGQSLGYLDWWDIPVLALALMPVSETFILVLAGLPFAWLWLRGWANLWSLPLMGGLCAMPAAIVLTGGKVNPQALMQYGAMGVASAFSFWAILRYAALRRARKTNAGVR